MNGNVENWQGHLEISLVLGMCGAVGQEMGCCVQKMEFMESACGALH